MTLERIRAIIQEDVGNRGLRADPVENLISATLDDFEQACRSLAEAAEPAVGIVTGFYIPHAQPPCAETDGPLGAIFLARALVPLGFKVVLATDAFCRPALEAGIWSAGLRKAVPLVTLPPAVQTDHLSPDDYRRYFAERAGPLTHLIALERVGPSHTPETFQSRPWATPELLEQFRHEVPEDHFGRCHTMKGRDITWHMSSAHCLFEGAGTSTGPAFTTIGIGDGGNEIGMGKISWEIIRRNIPGGGLAACRVPADQLIVCGISNWGAYGLAAGVRLLKGLPSDSELFDVARERELLQVMIDRGPLVDGVSGEPTLTVDGLSFERYAEPLRQLGEII